MAIKSPKQKGSSGEYEVIALLTSWGSEIGVPLTLERNLEQVRKGGSDINGVDGLEIEVKREEANNMNSWWRQVCAASDKTGKVPMLAHRKNRQPWRFRVRSHAAIYGPMHGRSGTVALDIDLELSQARLWFQHWLHFNQQIVVAQGGEPL